MINVVTPVVLIETDFPSNERKSINSHTDGIQKLNQLTLEEEVLPVQLGQPMVLA
jgi:hypothetical protein